MEVSQTRNPQSCKGYGFPDIQSEAGLSDLRDFCEAISEVFSLVR